MNNQPTSNKSILYGVISLVAGIGFIYFFIWRILEAMAKKQDNLTYSLKGVGIGPFLVVFGLYLLILRPPSLKPDQMLPRQRVVYWVMVSLSLVLSVLTFLWFKNQATQLGYNL
ncbi:hypothetical protein SAMN05518672_104388 [Chitinophaga sp. CF118]|uniref:hypothetical protein n=1 Tax=Chitinophaga sp. CF118 TaxID=1884367 RepID=UPI0008DF2815|nr:hypothetical protein [Chitinophaga sp. CF118]SFE07572.1 hypothetical protein SAMN05518672_104388 [Chitinophaga sp. CF118]